MVRCSVFTVIQHTRHRRRCIEANVLAYKFTSLAILYCTAEDSDDVVGWMCIEYAVTSTPESGKRITSEYVPKVHVNVAILDTCETNKSFRCFLRFTSWFAHLPSSLYCERILIIIIIMYSRRGSIFHSQRKRPAWCLVCATCVQIPDI